ncbi:MAG: hypothetical protein H6719_10425 [Sandaracinaceae bacterium]|nr:hypothetical protein [Sandaracinaceae bacterium]
MVAARGGMGFVELDARSIGLAALAAVALVQTLRLFWRDAARRWTLARRLERAKRGEHEAEALLAREGYRVLGRQVRAAVTYLVDGAAREAHVVADLLVSRGGRRYVAEVKTGDRATDPLCRPTRRQLLEYAQAFDVSGLLLVDPEAGRVLAVGVPGPAARGVPWAWVLAGAAVGWACAVLLE